MNQVHQVLAKIKQEQKVSIYTTNQKKGRLKILNIKHELHIKQIIN